jgi:hypothetical protein
MVQKKNINLGKKILYGFVITLSGFIALLCLVGIIGVWVVKSPLSDAAVATMKVVETSTGLIRQSSSRIDSALNVLQLKTTEIANASQQISQNVTDKGLVMVLLPEAQEQKLIEIATSVQDTYNGVRESIAKGLDLYRSINRIPFVNLPGLSDDQMDKIDNSMSQIQSLVETLRSQMSDFRSGVAVKIDKLTGAVDLLNDEITKVRDVLSQLDAKLAGIEELSVRLQKVIPGVLVALAVVLSLVLAFLIFTQVEVIRLYVAHWRQLGQPQEALPDEGLAQPIQEEIGGPEGE